jgi:HAD superfamily hydrolase (TIGR01509 family)
LDTGAILREKRALVSEKIGLVRPIEPVVSWLRWCHAEGMGLAVGSGGTRRIVLASLAATGLDAYFDPANIFTADDVAVGKPAPDLFLAAARALGVAPADCLVVEDGPPGIAAAAAAGMRCLDVRPILSHG